jgi:c(7)-type cytochrome triheme protein
MQRFPVGIAFAWHRGASLNRLLGYMTRGKSRILLGACRQWVLPVIGVAICMSVVPAVRDAAAFLRPVPGAPKRESAPAPPPKAREQLPTARGAQEQPEQNKFYDPANPAYAALQKANEALAGFPVDAKGNVDWMAALASGRIKPLADLHGQTQMQPLDLDIVMKNTRDMPYVRFPHRSHTLWLDCTNCHPALFEPKAGANRITMAEIFRGRHCGVCHDRVAFLTFFSCDRCHAVPHASGDGSIGP